MTQTHWKKLTNPNYLGAYAFDENQEMVVKIKEVRVESVQNAQGKEDKPVAYFEGGQVKPLILNSSCMKSITKVAGTPYIEKWAGVKVQLYVDRAVPAFGTITEGVRVRDFPPQG